MATKKLLLIALAGGLGALARYALSGLVQNLAGRDFPWGTASVNVLGCLLFGLCWGAFEERWAIGGEARMIIFVGFMGAFTTFSTYVFETGQLLRDAQWWPALGNVALQNILGAGGLLSGVLLGRYI
jgi:CrcB protein